MLTIRVQSDIARVSRSVGIFGRDLERATATALNKTIAKGKTQMAREIRDEYNLTSARIKERLSITRAKAFGRVKLVAELRGTGKRSMNVIPFVRGQRRPTKQQLKFQIRRGGPVKSIPGSFVGNAGRTVFRRTGASRLPIETVKTISIPQMFNQRRINQIVRDVMERDFAKTMEHEARYLASRL